MNVQSIVDVECVAGAEMKASGSQARALNLFN